jgi:single-strand DNA-binding protein
MNVNKVIVAGNLTRDPETRTISSGQTVTSFGLATNRFWTDKESGQKQKQTEYHNIVAWGKLGELAQEYLKKGSLAFVEGRLQTNAWEDQQGNKKSRTEIVAESLQFGPRTNGQSNQSDSSKEKQEYSEEKSSPEEINVEEIPF